jgi:hypothetical protein
MKGNEHRSAQEMGERQNLDGNKGRRPKEVEEERAQLPTRDKPA